jgi:hypothetical protein
LLVATSVASEAVIRNPTFGLQPYSETDSVTTGSGMTQQDTLKQGYMHHQEYGLQPYWGITIDSMESDMVQPSKKGETYQSTFEPEPYSER